MKKIPSGVYGLNPILDGGFNQGSTTVIIGSAGAGKTTLTTQFIRRGLEQGQEAIFVSLDENKEQIVKEAVEMGWSDILEYIDKELLVFIDASGKDFARFIKEELPAFVDQWKHSNARIVVDPLTPVIWAVKERYAQRDLLSFLFKQLRRVGTVVCTLEEHHPDGNLSGEEVVIPTYLADTVIHLQHRSTEDNVNRKLKVAKSRSSNHSELYHNYHIVKGLGLVVDRGEFRQVEDSGVSDEIKELLKKRARVLPPLVYKRILKAIDELRARDLVGVSPEALVDMIIDEYEGA